jgi:tetratricopeptide (TPR) repeat protein
LAARKRARHRPRKPKQPGAAPRKSELRLARRGETNPPVWELVHPRSALDRAEDIEEVRAMLEAGELDVARDELRWLLDGCTDCVDAHYLLGEIAYAEQDFPLARGHFGYVHQISVATFPTEGLKGTLPASLQGNRTFFEASKALAYCLRELNMNAKALEILDQLRRLDPSDTMEIAAVWRDFSGDVQQIKLL